MFTDELLDAIHDRVREQFGELTPITPAQPEDYFGKLAESIISQQLSTKVADVIELRARTAVGGVWEPSVVLATDIEALRSAGLSYAKANYIRNIAEAFTDGTVVADQLSSMTDAEVTNHLVQIKGVGVWTAEMFMMFTLARPNIFSVGDYGLRKAMSNLYGMDIKAKPAEFLTIANDWQPNRTLASRVLWKSLELV